MNYLLTSGTVVCSTVMLYGWSQVSASKAISQETEQKATQDQVTDALRPTSRQVLPLAQEGTIATLRQLPERFLNPEWTSSREQLPNTMESVYAALLAQAQEKAKGDHFGEAIDLVAGIPKNSRHYEITQRLQEDWSQALLQQATEQYQQAQVTSAIALLDAIPSTSSLHDRTTELRQRWKQHAQLLNRAISAKNTGDWNTAIATIRSLDGTPLANSLLVQNLLQQAMTQRYEPNRTLLQIAMTGVPAVQPEAPQF